MKSAENSLRFKDLGELDDDFGAVKYTAPFHFDLNFCWITSFISCGTDTVGQRSSFTLSWKTFLSPGL